MAEGGNGEKGKLEERCQDKMSKLGKRKSQIFRVWKKSIKRISKEVVR